MSLENPNANSKEQIYQGVLTRLSNLIEDQSISDDKYTAVRQSLGSVYTILNNEFDLHADNKEVLQSALNKLMILTDSNLELKESEFETFRNGLGSVITMINNELA